MSNKEQILILYFDSKLKIVEIAERLQISKQYVSKIVKQDRRCFTEKQNRKDINKQKQKDRFKNYISQKRKSEKERSLRLDYVLKMQHNQAVSELSGRKTISNRAIRKWCAGAYNYNNEKNQFDFDTNVGRSYAMPKHINWK